MAFSGWLSRDGPIPGQLAWDRWRQQVFALFDQLLPDPPFVSYAELKPSWLRGPQGERLQLDLFYPDLPLVVDLARPSTILEYGPDRFVWVVEPSQEWQRHCQVRQVLAQLQVPYVLIRPDMVLEPHLIGNLIRSAALQVPDRVEQIEAALAQSPFGSLERGTGPWSSG